MREEVYTSRDIQYVAVRELRDSHDAVRYDTPQEAWNSVPFWDQQDFEWDVYEVLTEVKIKKVEPPWA